MSNNKVKLFIGTPMYAGMCCGFYVQSLLNLNRQMAGKMEIVMSFMFNESLITRARNALVHGFLKTDATHLMFIDADIHFYAEDVLPMVEADKDVICGIYPKKEIYWNGVENAVKQGIPTASLKHYTGSFVVNLVDHAGSVTVPVSQPVEIWNGGTGFMLIKREVFDKMKPLVPTYTNDVADLAGNLGADTISEYFTTSIDPESNRLLSEDYHFCHYWRKAGGKVWAAPWVRLAHVGTYIFDGKLIPSP